LPQQRHGGEESASPTPGSLFGRGWARAMCEGLFNLADRLRKKLVTKLNNLFYVFTSYSTSNTPKTMELRFPHASRLSHLSSILPSVAVTSFWLVVTFKIIDRRPFKAAVYFIFYTFLLLNLPPQTMGQCPSTRSPAQRASALTPPLPLPLTIGLIVL
jgi:hypothetical protein